MRDDGAIVWDGIFVDITGRKQAEDRAALAAWTADSLPWAAKPSGPASGRALAESPLQVRRPVVQ